MGLGRAKILPSSPNHFFPFNGILHKDILYLKNKSSGGEVTHRSVALPPLFSKCGSPEHFHWPEIQEASPQHTGLHPPGNEASYFQGA